jgi:hypothetical protein
MGIYVLQNPSGAGLRWYLHDGVDPGYQADMIYVPEIDLAIVLFANTGMGREELIYVELLAVVVQTVLDMVLR